MHIHIFVFTLSSSHFLLNMANYTPPSSHFQACKGYPGLDDAGNKQELADVFIEAFGELLMDR
jgi:hypothetical protein